MHRIGGDGPPFGREGSSWTGSSGSVVAGPSPTGDGASCAPGARSSRPSGSPERGPGRGRRRPAVSGTATTSGRGAVAPGPGRRGEGPWRWSCGRRRPPASEARPDPEVAPPGILPARAKDRLLDRGVERRATGPAGPVSPSGQEFSVPLQQRVRVDQEASPPAPGEHTSGRGKQLTVGGGEAGSPPSPAEDLQLVAEHDGFELSWWRSTAFSRSSSSRPQRTSRRSRPHRNRYLMDQSIGQSDVGSAGLRMARVGVPDRVSLPHSVCEHTVGAPGGGAHHTCQPASSQRPRERRLSPLPLGFRSERRGF